MTTNSELLKAAKTLGTTSVNKNTNKDDLLAAINNVLGNPTGAGKSELNAEQQAEITESFAAVVNKAGPESVATKSGPVKAGARDIPNLSPNGQWQGKRARIKRTVTGHQDIGGALFRWNGWPTLIPLDREVDVAWPIWEILKGTVGVRVEVEQVEDPRDKGKINNIINQSKYNKYPYQFMGVTPGTEHLPESAWEYTLDQYVEGFEGFTARMWRQLCALWEMNDKDSGIKPGMGPEAEVEARRNAVHYLLNLPQTDDRDVRAAVRNEKRADIGMEAKAA